MEAIILAGGLGTRLSHIVSDVPKTMALVCGKPFLEYVLDNLEKNGFNHIVLAVGYMRNQIMDCFEKEYKGMKLTYSIEESLLGTGGGIKHALSFCNDQEVFVLNGDSFLDVNFKEMLYFHLMKSADITIATKHMKHFDRYGTINIDNDTKRILSFNEKKFQEEGIINGGIYLMKRNVLDGIKEKKFSIEKDVFENFNLNLNIYAFETKGYFIDIGVPEDYYRAQEEFAKF